MKVLIGVDPDKGSHTAVAIDGDEKQLAMLRVRATKTQCDQLLAVAQAHELAWMAAGLRRAARQWYPDGRRSPRFGTLANGKKAYDVRLRSPDGKQVSETYYRKQDASMLRMLPGSTSVGGHGPTPVSPR